MTPVRLVYGAAGHPLFVDRRRRVEPIDRLQRYRLIRHRGQHRMDDCRIVARRRWWAHQYGYVAGVRVVDFVSAACTVHGTNTIVRTNRWAIHDVCTEEGTNGEFRAGVKFDRNAFCWKLRGRLVIIIYTRALPLIMYIVEESTYSLWAHNSSNGLIIASGDAPSENTVLG